MLKPYDEQVKAIQEDRSLDSWYKTILPRKLAEAHDAAHSDEQER